ncbi:MAG: hypothetical protein ACFFDI_23280 [Promethearchaeota archaeon]
MSKLKDIPKKWLYVGLLVIIVGGSLIVSTFLSSLNTSVYPREIELNTEPQLSVGQMFHYKTNNVTYSDVMYFAHDTLLINQTVEIDGTTYYEVIRNSSSYYISSCASCPGNISVSITNYTDVLYYDKDTGTCIGKNINQLAFSNEDFYATDIGFFAYWMLGLKEGFKYEMVSEGDFYVYQFEVVGIESVEIENTQFQCFKTKMNVIYRGGLTEIRNYWIDIENRYTVQIEIIVGSYHTNLYKYLIT